VSKCIYRAPLITSESFDTITFTRCITDVLDISWPLPDSSVQCVH